MESRAVSNTGPILHLFEIELMSALNIFYKIFIPQEVASELRKKKVVIPNKIKITSLAAKSKDTVKVLTNQHNLDLGEAEAIALALENESDYFLTDDLDARQVAKEFGIEVHGTIGIILRAFREEIIGRKTAIEKIRELKTKSSLFITQDLIKEILDTVEDFDIHNSDDYSAQLRNCVDRESR